jgi:riboflavin synthase
MFTGIIEATAKILECGNGMLVIERPQEFNDIKEGSSIAVQGICLSVVQMNKKCIQFDVVAETVSKTTVASWKAGDRVNLERAMLASSRLDGHIVQGHIEGVGEVQNAEALLVVQIPRAILPTIVPKGSIAIDGVSLTVASIEGDCVSVALIPHTLKHTTLGALQQGDRVNIETDVLARHRATKH